MNQLTNVLAALGIVSLFSCGPDVPPAQLESSYDPVLMTRSVLEKAIRSSEPISIDVPGKIYRYADMLYISERYEGVHVIDNTDPSNPINKGFISIPGCVDIAVRHHTLFANSATDLVVIDISDLNNVVVDDRQPRLFAELQDPEGLSGLSTDESSTRPADTEIINWIEN